MSHTSVQTVDYHTGGEPFRIVPHPPVELPGSTVAERRAHAIGDTPADALRRLLCFEPRGHADMYGGFLTAPDDPGADFGVLFWHKDGFSTACGHGTMALGVWAVNSGLVPSAPGETTEVVIDVPSGRVRARVSIDDDGLARRAEFINVPSRLIATGLEAPTSRGPVAVSLGWGGAVYACVDAEALELPVVESNVAAFIGLGREVKAGLQDHPLVEHPTDPRLSGVYGTIFYEDAGLLEAGALYQRNVTVFADGQVDRSPCGSGTAARVGILSATGALSEDQSLVHDSIVGSRFTATIIEHTTEHGKPSVIPRVAGSAHQVAESQFTVDPKDPLVPGFVLR